MALFVSCAGAALAQPQLVISPPAPAPGTPFLPGGLQFLNQAVGTSRTQSVTLRNVGDQDLIFVATKGGSADFRVSGLALNTNVTLAPGASQTFSVTFTPTGSTASGQNQRFGFIQFTSNSAILRQQFLALFGTAVATVPNSPPVTTTPVPALCLNGSPGPLTINIPGFHSLGNFFPPEPGAGSPPPGSTRALPPGTGPILFSISNCGAGGSILRINSITRSGNTSDFQITDSGSHALAGTLGPFNLAQGGSLVLGVRFRPLVQGLRTLTLTINTNAGTSTITINGFGLNEFPFVNIVPGQLSKGFIQFGTEDVALCQFFAPRTFRDIQIRNFGNEPARIVSIGTSSGNASGDFLVDGGGGPRTLGQGATTTIRVFFCPTAVGVRTTNLVIAATDFPPTVIPLRGIGVAGNPVVSPAGPLSFCPVAFGGSSTQFVTLQNTGLGTLFVLGSSVDNPEFTTTGLGNLTQVPAGGSLVFSVTFTPSAADLTNETGTLTIFTNVGPVTVSLSGCSPAG